MPRRAAAAQAARRSTFRSYAELPWLQPYPDRLLDEIAPREDEPDAVVVARETIELAYIALIQLLPPRQRAVLILRDVLGWPAADTAAMLDISVAAANSALQRARATLEQHRPSRDAGPRGGELDETERALLQGFIDAHERADADAAVALVREDIRITMPPHPWVFEGIAAIQPLLHEGLTEPGEWRLVPTWANRHADRRDLPARARRHRVARVQVRRAAGRGRQDRRDHDVRQDAVPGVRAARAAGGPRPAGERDGS